jgi:PTH1 family peptidyl-tRNA hydrolase
MFIDHLKQLGDLPDFSLNNRFNSLMVEGKNHEREKIILVKPQTFMNLSGQAVRSILDFYKLSSDDLIVIHDDLDISLGEYKISTDASAAGHGGVQNIIAEIGTQKFIRYRIGIEGAEKRKERVIAGDIFVLQNFSKEEKEKIQKTLDTITNNFFQ